MAATKITWELSVIKKDCCIFIYFYYMAVFFCRVRGPSTPSSDHTDSSVATSSFFGSLRRLKGPPTSSTPKVDRRGKRPESLTLRTIDNNANFTTEPSAIRPKHPNNVTTRKNLFGLSPRSNVPKVSFNLITWYTTKAYLLMLSQLTLYLLK